jgi:hypothetical protein
MTIALYPQVVYENNLAPDHGGSEVDEACEQIHDATKGWGVRTHCIAMNNLLCRLILNNLFVIVPFLPNLLGK